MVRFDYQIEPGGAKNSDRELGSIYSSLRSIKEVRIS